MSTRSSPDSEPRPGVRFIGRYALLGKLASGGMATVHVGRLMGPVGFTRSVAIKRLHPEYARDPSFVSMFLDEARLAAQISHPNVVATLDVVATDGELFLVMDYVHGQSLSCLIRHAAKAGTRIPPRIVASILSGCLQGLHAAHEARDERGVALNIVHRDVSPQNVMVGADGLARVLDFGVAKAVGRIQNTREGHIKGKLAYMPPEQIQTDTISRQADVYATAVVLWEALTSLRLFKAETETGTLAKVLSGPVVPPSTHGDDIGPELDRVVMKGLARDPAARYPTARAMATDLERATPVASIAEVSDWLASVSKRELDERAARIAAIEMTAGLGSSEGMANLAAALAEATPPEEDSSSSNRLVAAGRGSENVSVSRRGGLRADTAPTSIQRTDLAQAMMAVRDAEGGEVEESVTMPHDRRDMEALGDDHSGESASQLSSVSLALGRAESLPPRSARKGAVLGVGMVFGAAALAAALWLGLGPRFGHRSAGDLASAPMAVDSAPALVVVIPSAPTSGAPAASGPANIASAPAPTPGERPTGDHAESDAAVTDSPATSPDRRPPSGSPRKPTPRKPPRGSGSPFDQLGGRD